MGARRGLTRYVGQAQCVGPGAWLTLVCLTVPGRVPADGHAAHRLARPRRPEGPAVGLPAGAALDKARPTPLLHALHHRLRSSQGAAWSTWAHAARRTSPPHSPRLVLSRSARP